MKKPFLFLLLLANLPLLSQDYKSYPMWNPQLPVEQRINDLISRLTLEEKVAQMLNGTPAVSRLGILGYDWWSEVLHGVARTPFRVTVFPQAIGMAATWDTVSLFQMADISALEGRAIYNKALKLNRSHERYLGLTYWTPNINIFRDPRWGRGQETYGEDPFLTAMLGKAFVHGLQGNDPNYLKAAACAKHFAVHSGPEPTRHSDDIHPSAYDLWDTYLPAFKELVVNAQVAGVMCAYNAVDTQPCCANDMLMNDILRKQWNFTGYVTSDCWALDDFFRFHKTHPDAQTAAVDALVHGTDVECGVSVYKTLLESVTTGMIAESQLDISLRRLFAIRYRLGQFDPPSMVKYAQTPESVLEAPDHQAHALKMARQSIVLLKNEKQTLPLSKNLKKIAVLGPNAQNEIAVLGNYNGIPTEIVTVLEGIKAKVGPGVEVVYEQAIQHANDTLFVEAGLPGTLQWEGKPGFRAQYFPNRNLEGTPLLDRMEPRIDLHWYEGGDLIPGVPATNFSARFTSSFVAAENGTITLQLEADDGYRLFINDQQVLNAWERNRWGARTYTLNMRKGTSYKITLEYWQGGGKADVRLTPGRFRKTDFTALANRLKDADVFIFAGGISPQLEGEEMPVEVPGFKGGDRTSILLPAVQTELMKALKATGKPVVFVMMTGSAIAIPWEDQNIPAILNAWYGGQSAGSAIADVLFGDYNPAGRLPVTFYKSDSDLPGFLNYDMTGRTYRYFKGEALYPFGYGLSYSTFRYDKLSVPSKVKSGKPLTVRVRVTNTGEMDGEEVAQLYVSHPGIPGKAPLRALKGFQRMPLKSGERRMLSFTLTPEMLSLINEEGTTYQPQGKLNIHAGGGQPGQGRTSSSNVLTKPVNVVK
ncbi:MAG: glycoside hydrolase family 3 C-terminal domain-containing protein [Haliscomenobacter sp.]|nr:glycoside hydrolase family 3 C-terminal domain-containing protein [Haliscomenobacter sp.]